MNKSSHSDQHETTHPLWSGRFSSAPDEAMMHFSTSLPVDCRLWRYDIQGSLAHVEMLGKQGILTASETEQIKNGLKQIVIEVEQEKLTFTDAPDEDIHSFVERNLTERIGAVAGKLHTARSRNDQVALDVRLYLKDALLQAQHAVRGLQKVLLSRAEEHLETVLPGYTHMQRAQPVLLSHHLLAYVQMLQRDYQRLSEALARADVMPLGAAALAGTTFPIDRHFVARQLGFSAVSENSMDTVADRDHITESTFILSLIMLHLSRLAEEIILWCTTEFKFVTLDDRFSTGSSIMPQKKNPDSMELVRGKSARVVGDLMQLITMTKSLPLTYNRDLQEDKEPLFDAFDTTISSLQIVYGVMETATFHADAMRSALVGGFSTATDVADYLVRRGVPFREAHAIVGKAVQVCEDQDKELEDLTLPQWQEIDSRFDEQVLESVRVDDSVRARNSHGGTSPKSVQKQLNAIKKIIG